MRISFEGLIRHLRLKSP